MSKSVLACPHKGDPAASLAAIASAKVNPKCRHAGLSVACEHGRRAGVLPDWAPESGSSGVVLQVLSGDIVTASTAALAGPCGNHERMLYVTPEAQGKFSSFSAALPVKGVPLDILHDFGYLVWPEQPRITDYTIGARSCSGQDLPIVIQVFPNIETTISLGFDFGAKEWDTSKRGGARGTCLSREQDEGWYVEGSITHDGTTWKASPDLDEWKERFYRIASCLRQLSQAADWLSAHFGNSGGGTIAIEKPRVALSGTWGWHEDRGTCACGFEFQGALKADPLIGMTVQQDISDWLFASFAPLLVVKHALEASGFGEIKVLLEGKGLLDGQIAGCKHISQRSFEGWQGKLGGEISFALIGQAAIETHFLMVSASAGASVEGRVTFCGSLTGRRSQEHDVPAVDALISFGGITVRYAIWGGVNWVDKENRKKRRGQSGEDDDIRRDQEVFVLAEAKDWYQGTFYFFGE